MFNLTGKTALVTGATGGIGGAVAERLTASGRFAMVHALSRSTGFDLEDEPTISAASGVSPGSTLPPGHSHRPAKDLPSGRWAKSTRPSGSIRATAETRTIFTSDNRR